MNLSNKERLNLKKLIDETDCENNTEQIRQLKHSVKIREDIRRMNQIKREKDSLKYSDPEAFLSLLKTECDFLFNNYTDIFNKLLKDEIDLKIMTRLLIVLKQIEDGKVDQHEGSVMVGQILKELYLDSAVRRADNLDKEHATEKPEINEGKKMSWAEFKLLHNK